MKGNLIKFLWLALGIGVVVSVYTYFFKKDEGGQTTKDKVDDSINSLGDAVKDIGEAVSNTANTVLELTQEEHETKAYRTKLQSLNKECDLMRSKYKVKSLSNEVLKERADTIHMEYNSWNEDETKILQQFLHWKVPTYVVSAFIANRNDKQAMQIVKAGTITKADYYGIKKAFGLAVDKDKYLTVKEKILYRSPELTYSLNFIINNLK